ncbi:hypothetical protein [Streptomyces sp. NPDC051310]|uniref:hypothetical protein n=1 Tax=Streptomyces sp. NPDC051310 TaxID=3365649 RepID=UPI0037BC3DEC
MNSRKLRMPEFMAQHPSVLRRALGIHDDDVAGTVLVLAYHLAARAERGLITADGIPLRTSGALRSSRYAVRVAVEVEDLDEPLHERPADRDALRAVRQDAEFLRLANAASNELGALTASLRRLGSFTAALQRLAEPEGGEHQ